MRKLLLSPRSIIESTIEKRCIADLMAKQTLPGDAREKLSHAFGICRKSMQRSGNYKPGSEQLTKQGANRSAVHGRRKDNATKINNYEAALKKARNSK